MPQDEQIAASSAVEVTPQNYDGMSDEEIEAALLQPNKPGPAPDDNTADPPDSPTEQQSKNKTEQRFHELLKDRSDLRKTNDELRERLARLEGRMDERAGKSSDPEAQAPKRPEKPKLDDFDTYAAYEEAKDQWNEEVRAFDIKAALEADRKERAETRTKEKAEDDKARARATVVDAFKERVQAVAEQYPDFEKVVRNPDVPINEVMREFIFESEVGPHVAYHLGKDGGAEAKRISELSPIRQVRELAKIEDQFGKSSSTGKQEAKPVASVKKLSSASAPPGEVGGMAATPDDEALAALAAGDQGKYMRIMNERDLAKLRKR